MPVLPEVGSMMTEPGLSDALGLGVIDHGLGDTVLDRAGRVEVLQLSQDLGLAGLRQPFDMGELQQRASGRSAGQRKCRFCSWWCPPNLYKVIVYVIVCS